MEVAIKTGLPTFGRLGRMSVLTGLQKRQDLCMYGGGVHCCFALSLQGVLSFLMGVSGCSFGHCTVPNIHSMALIDLFIVLITK